MELRAGYKQTEVGVIPEDWDVQNLGTFGRFRGGNGFPLRYQGHVFGDYPFFKVSDMNNDGNALFMQNSNHWITEKIRKELGATAYPSGSIIFAKIGAAIFLERKKILSRDSCIDNNVMAFVFSSPAADWRFFHYIFLTIELGKLVSATALPSLNGRDIAALTFGFPKAPEQRAIAAALSDADTLIASLDALIAKKRDLKQAAMQQLLTGKTRLPGFLGEWEVKRLGDVANIKTGKRNNQDKQEDGAFPFFVRSETVERINSFSHDCEAILIPGEGNIGSIFHYIVGKFDVHQRVYAITNFIGSVSGKFVHLWMRMNFGAHAMQNTVKATVDSLRLPTFQNFELMLPPTLAEQTAIAEILSDMDAELAELEAQRDKARALKQGMIQELLTGRIRLV